MSQQPTGVHQLDDVDEVAADLVEYIVVMVPDHDAVARLSPAVATLVQSGSIRLLDLVVVVCDDHGAVTVLELDEVESLGALTDVAVSLGGWLTDNDIRLASLALPPSTTGIVLVAEDRWLEPLAAAARDVGGRITAGERIPRQRIEAALMSVDDVEEGR